MLRVDQLVARIRAWTENEDATTTAGIPDQDIIDALCDGQNMLQGAIMRNVPECSWFNAKKVYTVTANQPNYAIPTSAFYSDSVRLVEFSFNSSDLYYVPIEPGQVQHLARFSSWPPTRYAIEAGNIVLSPPPRISQGLLRVTYTQRVPPLARILGQVTSYSAPNLTLDNDSFLQSTVLGGVVPSYFSVSSALDGYGVSYDVVGTAYNSGTRVLTVDSLTYEGAYGASDMATGFLTAGARTTCIAQWPVAIQPEVERYLRAYGIWKILGRESSEDRAEQGNELTAIEGDIINAARSAHADYPLVTMDRW